MFPEPIKHRLVFYSPLKTMKTSLVYVALASLGSVCVLVLFVVVTGLFPMLAARIDYGLLGQISAYLMILGIIPAAAVLGFNRQLREEDRSRGQPVHEDEHLRPLQLGGLSATLRALAAGRR